jgi:nucleoside-diphosphate-sugar epimerase
VKVAVLGATGTIGTAVVPVLAREHEVVAVARRARAPKAGAEVVAADVTDSGAVRRALDGVDVAYYLVHSLGAHEFERRDLRAAETVAAEAGRAGVRQLVYLGGLGDAPRSWSARAAPPSRPSSRSSTGCLSWFARAGCRPVRSRSRYRAVRYLAGVCGREETFGKTVDAAGSEVMSYRAMIERIARLRGVGLASSRCPC